MAFSHLVLWATLTPNGVELVDEDDRGLLFPGGCKQVPDTLCSNTDEHLVEFRSEALIFE